MSKRYNPDKNIGLNKEQVNERIKDVCIKGYNQVYELLAELEIE